MKNHPLFFYVVYELPEGLHGYLVDWKPPWEASKDYSLVYKFEGREATYWIATNDNNIIRHDALVFATAMHEGKVVRYSVDLASVSR